MVINKSGQVTIFVIIGVVLVGAIILFFVLRGGGDGGSDDDFVDVTYSESEIQPNDFLETCLEPHVRDAIREISHHGGYVKDAPIANDILTNNEDVSYLCYIGEDGFPCEADLTNISLNNQLRVEIWKFLRNEGKGTLKGDYVKECFDKLVDNYVDNGFKVTERNYVGFNVDLLPSRLEVRLDADLVLEKGGNSFRVTSFWASFRTSLHSIAKAVSDIVAGLGVNCYFDFGSYFDEEITNPGSHLNYEDDKMLDGSYIYVVSHSSTQEKFRFAIRSCAS